MTPPPRLAALAFTFTALLTACADDDNGVDAIPITPPPMVCSASLSPGRLTYQVDGNFIKVRPETGPEEIWLSSYDRGSTANQYAYGSWVVGEKAIDATYAGTLKLSIDIDTNRMTARAYCSRGGAYAFVKASSPIVVDETTIQVLQGDSQERTF